MICFLERSRQKGEQNFHGLWNRFEGFHPAQKSWIRATHHPGHTQQSISALELSSLVQFSTCSCILSRGVFSGTLVTNSIMVSGHVLQTCHHLMGYYCLLCTAIAMVPYLPSSLASPSFSFHYCLHSFVHPFPSHSISSQKMGAPGCGLSPG